ncbi:MAG TPA: hypothetical protein VN831_00110, partial [Bradyrhizobium sp.]|nr:hypothetical protein [Bradyrhizobium sp.]
LGLGFGGDVAHNRTLQVRLGFVTALIDHERFRINPDITSCCTATKYPASVTLKPQRFDFLFRTSSFRMTMVELGARN